MDEETKQFIIVVTGIVLVVAIVVSAVYHENVSQSELETCMEDCYSQYDASKTSDCRIKCVEKLGSMERTNGI